jgi:hypothetical protein
MAHYIFERMSYVLINVTIRWGVKIQERTAFFMPTLLLLQSCSEMEVSKVEECMYLKTAVFCRGNAWSAMHSYVKH